MTRKLRGPMAALTEELATLTEQDEALALAELEAAEQASEPEPVQASEPEPEQEVAVTAPVEPYKEPTQSILGSVHEIDTALIRSWAYKDRSEMEVGEDELEELIRQIETQGQLQPIMVRPIKDDKHAYEEIFGFKRLMACRELGIKVKAIVRELTDAEAFALQVSENTGRSEPSPWSRALSYRKARDAGLFPTVASLAKSCGLQRPTVANLLRVADKMPEALHRHPAVHDLGQTTLIDLAGRIDQDEKFAAFLTENAGKISTDRPLQSIRSLIRQFEEKVDNAPTEKVVTVYPVGETPNFFRVVRQGENVTINIIGRHEKIATDRLGEIFKQALEQAISEKPIKSNNKRQLQAK